MSPLTPLRPALVHPLVDALVVGDDDRRLVAVLGWHMAREHIRRFHDMVIDAHQNQIVNVHESVLSMRRFRARGATR